MNRYVDEERPRVEKKVRSDKGEGGQVFKFQGGGYVDKICSSENRMYFGAAF